MFDIIAHRGASKCAPENTLSSISKAMTFGIDYVEIDVHLSKDGVPVVIHDATLGRTTNGPLGKRIIDMTLQEIKSLDAGLWFGPQFAGEKIPTLAEVLDLNHGSLGWMIEIKKGFSPIKTLVKAICDVLRQQNTGFFEKIIVGSFSLNILEELHDQFSKLPLIGIAEDFNMIPILQAKKLPMLALWYKLINPPLVQALHEANSKVWAFTVDDPKIADFLLSIHVDGLITNDSLTMLQLKTERKAPL